MDKAKTIKLLFLIIVLGVCSYGVSLIIKDLLRVPRPCVENRTCPGVNNPYDIPSSHTTVVFSVVVFLSLILKGRWVRLLLLSGAVVVGIQRLITEYHSVLGVFSGALIGTLMGVFWYSIWSHKA